MLHYPTIHHPQNVDRLGIKGHFPVLKVLGNVPPQPIPT